MQAMLRIVSLFPVSEEKETRGRVWITILEVYLHSTNDSWL